MSKTEKKTASFSSLGYELLSILLSIEIETCYLSIREHIALDADVNALNELRKNWTGKSIWLVELIYALHSVPVVNGGTVDIKDLIALFEFIFNVKLKRFYDTFITLRGLKKDRTPFLNMLKEAILRRMDEMDK